MQPASFATKVGIYEAKERPTALEDFASQTARFI